MTVIATNANTSRSLIKIAEFCSDKNLVPASSGNFSARINENRILISQSGKDKGNLSQADLMEIDYAGYAVSNNYTPSAETLLHTQIYSFFPEVNYVAHFHSSVSAVLSKLLQDKGIQEVKLSDFELLKAFSGVDTHEHTEIIPIFRNNQNIVELCEEIQPLIEIKLANNQNLHAYLIAGHGVYTWGKNGNETIRHIDAINTLLESYILEMQLR